MKILFVFLACIFAANATSYVLPYYCTYEYYVEHQFYVYPETSCYCFNIYFPHCWTEAEYYEPVLHVYPDETCGITGWEEKDVDVIKEEIENALAISRGTMRQEMMSQKPEFVLHIDQVHLAYVQAYRKFLEQFYVYACFELIDVDAKVAEYSAELDVKKTDALTKFDEAVNANMNVIQASHDDLVTSAVTCLTTRLQKIEQYEALVDQKINEFVNTFIENSVVVLEINKKYLEQTFASLYLTDDELQYLVPKTEEVVQIYYDQEYDYIQTLSNTYRNELQIYRKQLVSFYTCSYKCYINNGCLRFFEENYQKQCKSLGCWYETKTCYDYKLYKIAPFHISYEPCENDVTLACDIDTVVDDISNTIDEIIAARDANINQMIDDFTSWKSTWESYHDEYKRTFEAIVSERHAFVIEYKRQQYLLYNNPLTQEQIDCINELEAELADLTIEVCTKYNKDLDVRLEDVQEIFNNFIDRYIQSIDNLITKLEDAFNTCMHERDYAIQVNLDKIIAARDAQKEQLENQLYSLKDAHTAKYDELIRVYYSTNDIPDFIQCLRICYFGILNDRINAVLSKFDSYWAELIELLSMNYQCGYECTAEYCLPDVYTTPRWHYELPCEASYTCYYSCYCSYHFV